LLIEKNAGVCNRNNRNIRSVKILVVLIIVLFALKLGATSSSVKKRCSLIELKRVGEGKENFSKYYGKKLMVVFWSPTCSHCIDMIGSLKKIYNDYKGKVELISLLMIPVDGKVKKTIKAYGIPYAVYEKNEALIECLGGVWMYPTIYFIDDKGIIKKVTEGEQEEDYLRYLIDRKLGVEECKCGIGVRDKKGENK